jgi:dipeptidyl-peptidase III
VITFSNPDGSCADLDKLKEDSKVSSEYWNHAITYTAQVFGNLVNYKSFGFSKFIPRIKSDDFKAIVAASPSSVDALARWEKVRGASRDH